MLPPTTAARLSRFQSPLSYLRRVPFPATCLRARPSLPLSPFVRSLSSTSPTMSQTIIFTPEAMSPVGPYSQAIKTPIGIFCSGQIPADKDGNIIEGTIADKTAQVIKNLKAVLAAADSSIEKVVKFTIFLTDMNDFAAVNTEYAKWITHKPARSCVAVKTLPKNVDIEIECIAMP